MRIGVCSITDFLEMKEKVLETKEPLLYVVLSNIYTPELTNLKPLIQIHCSDVNMYEEGFITDAQIIELYLFLRRYWIIDNMIVMCDAGISRSPAVAIALTEFFGNTQDVIEKKKAYPYYNDDMYRKVIVKLRELEEEEKEKEI